MSKNKKSKSGSNKLTSWLKPWAKENKQPDKASAPPPKGTKSVERNSPKRPIEPPHKNSFATKRTRPKSQYHTPNEISKTPWEISPLTPNTKTSNPRVKLRSLGTQQVANKQIANQPISIPIKQTLDTMIDVLNKVKGSSKVPLRKESIPQPEAPKKVESLITEEPVVPSELETETTLNDLNHTTFQEYSGSYEADSASHEVEPYFPPKDSTSPQEDLAPLEVVLNLPQSEPPKQPLPPISDTLTEIRHIKIWSLDSDFIDPSDKSTDELFSEAMTLYQLGLAGEKEAVPQAFKLLIHVLQNDRQNLLAEAYLGSVISLMGRDADDANDRFKFAIKGLKILDKVVSMEPENVEIRGLRAFVCSRLPEQFFHRSDTAIEDFSYLVSRNDEDDSLFPKEFYHQILYELALAYHRLDKRNDAESTCRKLLSLTNDPKYKVLIKQEGILGSDLPRRKRQPERKSGIKNEWSKLMYDEKLQEGISLHSRAIAEDQYALEKAFDIFKQAHKRDPHDPLIKAYYADCLSLLGLNSSDTSTMFRHTSHAIKTLDLAVNSRPDDITIRFIRGYNSYRIPEAFFRRTLTAIHDFNYILKRYEDDSSLLPEETYWQILYDLGDAYERLEMTEEAHSTWGKLSQCGDTPYKNFVDELLNENSEILLSLNSDQNPKELLLEGIRLHELASTGNKKVSAKAYEVLLKAHQADITNPLAQGYLGSSMAILGQSKTDPNEIYHYFFKGMNHLNKAIANDSNNYLLHLLLAKVMYHYSPSFFRGNEKIIKEFKFLKLAYERNHSIFPEEEYLQILNNLGACYKRTGDHEKATKCWEKLSKLTIDPKYNNLVEGEQEGAVDMDKDKIRDKFKEIAVDIALEKAKERAKEKGGRKERKSSNERTPEKSADVPVEKKHRRRKEREKDHAVPPVPETTSRKRKKDHKKEETPPIVTKAPESVKLSPEEKKARREEKEKARAAALEKAMSRVKRTKKE